MLAIRFALSDPAKAAERDALVDEHKAHLRSGHVSIVQSGPINDASGVYRGGVVVASVGSMDEMRQFSERDPFVVHGVYSSVSIYEWRSTISNWD
ncbi:YciI family protein [Allorhizobium pseudoryzae]|jgi:hypothetical protein|uniref:YciI family protein n=1 Tax=Allorhizobium pseudoryzae TaxID=379684 RepID=UPI003CFCD35F